MKTSPLRLAAIGLGPRSYGYLSMAATNPDHYTVVAGADYQPELVRRMAAASGIPDFRGFSSDVEILAEPQLADVMVIGTQDAQHRDHAIAAMERGYDLLLEKPIASTLEDVLAVEAVATRLGRRVLVCHVLRYTTLYSKIKELVISGRIGKVISLNATEGVGAFHQAHSYVRGHWSRTEEASPMIIAKSCHDLDLIQWIIDQPCLSVSSHGSLEYFTERHAPEDAPLRCTDGCPKNGICFYDAHHYATTQRKWLYVKPELMAEDTPPERILDWIKTSPWSRCVYRCDNTAVDHQVVSMQFGGNVTATFTMTAFTEGRGMEIYGTKGVIRAGELYRQLTGADILVQELDSADIERVEIQSLTGGYDSHGGGDQGLVEAIYHEMRKPSATEMNSSIQTSVASHIIGFAAEESRLSGQSIEIEAFRRAAMAV